MEKDIFESEHNFVLIKSMSKVLFKKTLIALMFASVGSIFFYFTIHFLSTNNLGKNFLLEKKLDYKNEKSLPIISKIF